VLHTQIKRLAAALPTTHAPDVPHNAGGKEDKRAAPDPKLKATRPLE